MREGIFKRVLDIQIINEIGITEYGNMLKSMGMVAAIIPLSFVCTSRFIRHWKKISLQRISPLTSFGYVLSE